MKHYEIIAHTADIRLYVEASTLEELFNAALAGMAQIIMPDQCKNLCKEQCEITTKSVDTTVLLIDFLSDVLTQTHITKTMYCFAEFTAFSSKELQARLFGVRGNEFAEDVKAVTYHEAEVKKNDKGNWETIIVFDI